MPLFGGTNSNMYKELKNLLELVTKILTSFHAELCWQESWSRALILHNEVGRIGIFVEQTIPVAGRFCTFD
jgi:hypothetical protein